MAYTTVRSDLARQDVKDTTSERCASEYTLKQTLWAGYTKGTTLRCTRPASGHRVHESGAVQWTHGNR